MTRASKLYLLTICVLAMVGCDGAGDYAVPPSRNVPMDGADTGDDINPSSAFIAGEPGEGIWRGTLTPDSSGEPRTLIGLINGWGGMRLLGPDSQYIGWIDRDDLPNNEAEFTVQATGIRINGTTWPDGSRTVPFSIAGTISPATRRGASEGGEIRAAYTGAGDAGAISLSFDFASNRGLSLDRLGGMWVMQDETGNIAATFTISMGTLEGSDEDGCVYAGEISADPIGHSSLLFDVSLTVSNCPRTSITNASGYYRGSAGLTDIERDSGENNWLIIGVNNEDLDRAITLSLRRM